MLQTSSRLLLVVALLVGQWLALAHDYEHPLLKADETCQVCLHAPSFHGAPSSQPPRVATPPASFEAGTAPAVLSPRRPHSPANSRAPPSIPA